MCMICTEFLKGKMNIREVKRATMEILLFSDKDKDKDHAQEILDASLVYDLEKLKEMGKEENNGSKA